MKLIFVLIVALGSAAFAAPPNFQEHVVPILKEHCLSCHNPDKKKAGLDLSSLKSIQIGSSGGEIVKAGVPDTSPLFMSIDHHEDYEPMPPKKPKISAEQLKVVHAWIAGGLIESASGKSQLRDVTFDLAKGSAERPEHPALPVNLPEIALAKTNLPPPVVAMAASPWADLFAASGHEQILLYGKGANPKDSPDFELVAKEDLITQGDFSGAEAELKEVPPNFLRDHGQFTFSAWLKPDLSMQSPTVFGRSSFYILLERKTGGWTIRAQSRSEENAVTYFGRVGQMSEGGKVPIAVTCDGKEWAFYVGGKEVVRQAIRDDKQGFLDNDKPFFIGGDGADESRRYKGAIEDFRLYRRSLSGEEIGQIIQNSSPTYQHIGTLPFPEGAVHDLRFSRNGDLLVAAGGVGAYSGKVVIYDVKTGKRQAVIGDEQDIVLSADISADHQFVAIGTPAKMVKIFSAKNGKLLHRIEKHTDWVTAVRFSPDGKLLASGDRNGGIHVWEAANAGIVYTLDEHKVKVTSLSWRPDGQLLASADEAGKFVLWDMKDGWPTRTSTGHAAQPKSRYSKRTGILDISFARDGRMITIGRDRAIRWWATDGNPLGEILDLSALPTRSAFGVDGKLAFVGDFGGSIVVWDLETKTRLVTLLPYH
ncbi:MAG: hypothetical protein ACI8UO_000460 [Verrucomicrobiales bacterium]|jgi:hypothetical protein